MLMKLPHSEFRWLSESELNAFNVESFNCAGDYGVVLEVIASFNLNYYKTINVNILNAN